MGRLNVIICDGCKSMVTKGNKYFIIMERVKGNRNNKTKSYCPKCIQINSSFKEDK